MSAMDTANTVRSLEDLAGTANREHAAAEDAARTWLEHAVAAGSALLEARSRVEPGGWARWVEDNIEFSYTTIREYMRVAKHPEQAQGASEKTRRGVLSHISSLPAASSGVWRSTEEDRQYAAERVSEGASLRTVAEEIGVTSDTINSWVNPEVRKRRAERHRKRQLRRRREQAALQEKEEREARDAAAKRAGGAASHAYAHTRKTLTHLMAAVEEASNREAEAAYREALSLAQKVEDEIHRGNGVHA